eukprot:m.135519 g.135519  ORF g.135519 m.135519 type:complete len:230 (+) comp13907_c0_seq3:101-790(+)
MTTTIGEDAHDAYIIWAHGLGDTPAGWRLACNTANQRLAEKGHKIKWDLPKAPTQPVSCNGGMVMTSWMDLEDIPITPSTPDTGKDLDGSVDIISKLVDAEVAFGTPRSRIIVGGFSQGGALALTSALKMKEPIGGACCFSSWAPPSAELAIDASRIAKEAGATAFLVCHGSSDGTVLPECGQAVHKMLTTAGLQVDFKVYPGMAHSSCAQEIDDLVTFIDTVLKKNDK